MTYIADTTAQLQETLQGRIDSKTKPLGALGRLEELALQVGMIQGTAHPRLTHPHIVVFAGDHGIAATGLVNPYPQAVTAQMVLNFLQGGAAINVLCRQHGIGLQVVDAGVNVDFAQLLPEGTPSLIDEKIAPGTRNYLEGEAMTREDALRAMEAGKKIVTGLHKEGCNCIGLGEMGIGNTSSASLIMSFVTGFPVEECCGRGTGVNDQQLETKIATLRAVHRRHVQAIAASPDVVTILRHVGGYEIAMMTGAYLQAAALKMVILVDGFITTAALLLATLLDPEVKDFCIYSHTSGEQGHQRMLEYLNARPLLNLGMRLGEGTGAAMAYPIVQSAMAFLREMASFESAGVSKRE
ncbi:nicotinate-nucleotide--dimethylbenzimidazole phosphoribosyltransferase [Flavitalea sp. BT771]|uniref:nicotinate-nucleotide--dimethylbenzimidazole phosphoribosyltransferase n=1 Tax=Flavitalea sp. BT771 TaxID=3063329 RepID=UPI0026E3E936|nr:nicotinate-nucleotide--dimethylbenzimidazole phosphoribosyltransferase [Flavitalea sp. BT771]MDO6434103.1 nicotinate-nucleotide--dimethylbenzimidazole phosphoribosyltransferase [Flavitalea sp. BT771]MDV6223003.1 nicotinate-nucleotide--dimethylbenzimidazole phosphoribosyltransferase [Flavitalea sp. BT771]